MQKSKFTGKKRPAENELRKYLLKKIVDKRFRSYEICFDVILYSFPDRVANEEEVAKMLAWSLLYSRRFEPCADTLKNWLQTPNIEWRFDNQLYRVFIDCPDKSAYLLFCMWNIDTGRCAKITIKKKNLNSSNFKDCHEALFGIDYVVSKHA